MHVIFNADDFGLTPGVNLGIAQACQAGVVRSTTLMVGMAAEQHALEIASSLPSLAVGLHLRFTAGSPLTAAADLVGNDGQFLAKERFWQKQSFAEQQVADEVTAQIEHFLATGLSLTHVDSHHHVHMHPKLQPVIEEVVDGYQVPLRASCRYHSQQYMFSQDFYGDRLSLDKLLAIIERYRGRCEVLEIMCHPAYLDQPLIESSGYVLARATELDILTDERLSNILPQWGVVTGDFKRLRRAVATV
ncbi:chitin disaccharide deacetylase [Photobacterium lutimaris]|uniref:Chitin disaccharide deacetylase n=1 Tax=Photobacterium lutimaris TaxID=388278 RepID=A0A2T3IRH6_9GAMM|nr:chitin disaccharide deacetylase [Photobacterium lutimaris]PSU30951.1 chitin disaccharide deacetylase [Photobacterium lutimaris]TDR72186.1 hypothetical protein DFP78_114122 [Photobacterium lutimaris]